MASNSRTFFVGGNWKCTGTVKSVTELINGLNDDACTETLKSTGMNEEQSKREEEEEEENKEKN
jgi:hypothetical protein